MTSKIFLIALGSLGLRSPKIKGLGTSRQTEVLLRPARQDQQMHRHTDYARRSGTEERSSASKVTWSDRHLIGATARPGEVTTGESSTHDWQGRAATLCRAGARGLLSS